MTTSITKIEKLKLSTDFADEVKKRSGVDFNLCYHCQSCAGGCPFAEAMDFLPNRIIRLVQLEFKEMALKCSSIWICVGCDTCAIQCPNGIDISAITHTLCQMAIEEKETVGEPDILNFHRAVLNTIQRYGRAHKLEIMLRYKLYKRDWFSDFGVGVKMFAKRKLEVIPSRIQRINDIQEFFNQKKTG